MAERTDIYERRPSGMDEYLAIYNWHFSKRMAEFAARNFCKGVGLYQPEVFEKLCQGTEVLRLMKGYDAYYLAARIRHTHPSLSERQVICMVEDCLRNDYDTAPLTRFYADTMATDTPIIWEDML